MVVVTQPTLAWIWATTLVVCASLVHVTSQSSEKVAIGIDLGTSFSVGSYWDPVAKKIQVVRNPKTNRCLFPSVVFIDKDGSVSVGDDAVAKGRRDHSRMFHGIKRLIGQDTETILREAKMLNLKVSPNPVTKVLQLSTTVNGRQKLIHFREISTHVLREVLRAAEAQMGKKVSDVVITIPANFGNAEKSVTETAAKALGLNVINLLHEPTAAAVAYGLDENIPIDEVRNVCVFDLGGGTFDVSVVELSSGGRMRVSATLGDLHLGGEDFSDCVLKELKRSAKKIGADENDPVIINILRKAAEEMKISLSSEHEATADVMLPIKAGRKARLVHTMSASTFDKITNHLVRRINKPLNGALKDAKIERPSDIDAVVMVGGSTRLRGIKQAVRKYFGKNVPIHDDINPDESVARGAGAYAAKFSTGIDDKAIKDLVVLDILSKTLSIEVLGNKACPMISRLHPLPHVEEKEFTTSEDNQEMVTIRVFEGESDDTRENKLLGSFDLRNIQRGKKGEASILVNFNLDNSGVLTISARDPITNSFECLTIQSEDGTFEPTSASNLAKLGTSHFALAKDPVVKNYLVKEKTYYQDLLLARIITLGVISTSAFLIWHKWAGSHMIPSILFSASIGIAISGILFWNQAASPAEMLENEIQALKRFERIAHSLSNISQVRKVLADKNLMLNKVKGLMHLPSHSKETLLHHSLKG